MRTSLMIATIAAALSVVPAHAADIALTNAWVRLPAVPGRPAAAYFTATALSAAQAIVGVSSPSAKRAELHESMTAGGTMMMKPLPRLPLAKGQSVTLKPGGKHVMLFELDKKLKPGQTVRLDVKLANGATVSTDAKAVGPAGTAPAAAKPMHDMKGMGDMNGMDMGHDHH